MFAWILFLAKEHNRKNLLLALASVIAVIVTKLVYSPFSQPVSTGFTVETGYNGFKAYCLKIKIPIL